MGKPTQKHANLKFIKAKESNKEQNREPDDQENKKEKETEKEEGRKEKKRETSPNEENEKMQGKEVKSKKQKVNEQEIGTRRMTRGQMKTRIRIGESGALRMASMMVDKLVSTAIRVQCDDDLFGFPSFTYLSFEDFEAIFTLDQLTGSVITSYIM